MKKLLVLALVLALSSIATASMAMVSLEVTAGESTGNFEGIPSYEDSTWITIGLMQSDFGTGFMDGIFDIQIAKATATAGTGASPGVNAGFDDNISKKPGTPGPATDVIVDIRGAVDTIGGSPAVTTSPLWWFDLHVSGKYSDIIVIDLVDLALRNAIGTDLVFTGPEVLEIHVTPEPMTIALLGLGGLFLRRRK